MSFTGHAPPSPLLQTPGKPVVSWPQWKELFENFLTAAGGDEMSLVRRKAVLLHSLGVEGQPVFYALPPLPEGDSAPQAYSIYYYNSRSYYCNRYNTGSRDD